MFTIPELRASQGRLRPLRCPHCRAALRQFDLVTAARNCPECGRRVVAEPEDNDSPPSFTREQLDAAWAAERRVESRIAWIFLAVFLAWFGGLAAAALYRDTIRDAVRPVIDPGWFLILVVMVCPMLAGMTVVCVYLAWAYRRAPACPHCSAVLSYLAHLVRATGNCRSCGRRLVSDPTPEEPSGPLPSIAEFKGSAARVGRAGDRTVCALFVWLVVFNVGGMLAVDEATRDRFWAAVESRYGLKGTVLAVLGVTFGVAGGGVGVLAGGLYLIHRRRERMRRAGPLLSCPHCRVALSRVPLVIASRRCPQCLRRVLADPDGVADAPAGPVARPG